MAYSPAIQAKLDAAGVSTLEEWNQQMSQPTGAGVNAVQTAAGQAAAGLPAQTPIAAPAPAAPAVTPVYGAPEATTTVAAPARLPAIAAPPQPIAAPGTPTTYNSSVTQPAVAPPAQVAAPAPVVYGNAPGNTPGGAVPNMTVAAPTSAQYGTAADGQFDWTNYVNQANNHTDTPAVAESAAETARRLEPAYQPGAGLNIATDPTTGLPTLFAPGQTPSAPTGNENVNPGGGFVQPGSTSAANPGGTPITGPIGAVGDQTAQIQKLMEMLGIGRGTTETGGAAPSTAATTFGPGNDLRATQITGDADPRTAAADKILQDQLAAINGVKTDAPTTFTPSAEAARARALAAAGLENVSGGPDRNALALKALQLFDEQQAPIERQGIQNIGRAAATFGRLNSGMTTNELTDFGLTRARDRDRLKEQLANEAAQQTMADNLARLNAAQSTAGQFRGEDLSAANFGQDAQARAAALALTKGQALGNIGNTVFDRGAALRGEQRGERGYQNDMANQATDRSIQQLTLEDALLNSEFGREQSRLNSVLPYAFGGGPENALLAAANQTGAGGIDMEALGRLWAQLQAGG